MKRLATLFGLLLWSLLAQAADSALLDVPQLLALLKQDQPCCVIDARDEGRRRQHPIAFAVPYRDDIKPRPGGYALVVADDDARALQAAQSLARNSGQTVHAVKGGYAVWIQVSKRVQGDGRVDEDVTPAGLDGLTPRQFTIPSNTCEQGDALHEYK